MEYPDWIETWFSQVRDQSHLMVSKISIKDSSEWSMMDGQIRHRSGRFFQVAGVSWEDHLGEEFLQPLLIQKEIGTLGFLMREKELLVQAKVEPGNVGVVQMAPTCQATASNLDRIHGGEAPLFAECFTPRNRQIIHESLQSEQGSRFFQKFNRNVLAAMSSKLPSGGAFRWITVDTILELISTDFVINTDARSVLVCSPWESLAGRTPFTRFSTSFAQELALSYEAPNTDETILSLTKELLDLRTLLHRPSIIRLDKLAGWQVNDGRIAPVSEKPFEIYQIKVEVAGREVSTWDQPILSSFGEGYVELVCGRINGILHFLFSVQIEPGLSNIAELGPSLVVEPGKSIPENIFQSRPRAIVLAECRQSDEGGRFFQDISTYKLIDIGEVKDDLKTGKWLTLATIRELLRTGGWFTNEARSALSLILTWL